MSTHDYKYTFSDGVTLPVSPITVHTRLNLRTDVFYLASTDYPPDLVASIYRIGGDYIIKPVNDYATNIAELMNLTRYKITPRQILRSSFIG